MSEFVTGRVTKRRKGRRVKSNTVLRMMAIMQDRNNEVPKEFLETGRTGRRNAMPDILHPQGTEVTTADLATQFNQMVTTDSTSPKPGPSNTEIDAKKLDETSAKKDSCS